MGPLEKLEALTARLQSTAELWRLRPFANLPVPWEATHPDISRSLRALSVSEVDAARRDLTRVRDISPELLEIFDRNERLTRWPDLRPETAWLDASRNPLRVSGRKWRQVERFVSLVAERATGSDGRVDRWLDWCSGKGHLGRALSEVTSKTSVFVEKDPKLCLEGHVNADVLQTDLSHLFTADTGAVALHACGNLNIALLETAVRSDLRFVAVAPCCYQRIVGTEYTPISAAGKASSLHLKSADLRLVSFEEVVSGRGEKARRDREHAFRLGFDLLVREATGTETYTPLGQLPGTFFKESFERFARLTAEKRDLPLPNRWDPHTYEKAGSKRWELNRALSIVRSLFARSLESWLLLDRILYLEESGWDVTAGTFCESKVTPRNLIIIAEQ